MDYMIYKIFVISHQCLVDINCGHDSCIGTMCDNLTLT